MTTWTLVRSSTLGLALSSCLFGTTACGGSDPSTGPNETSGAGGSLSGGSSGAMAPAGPNTAGTSTAGTSGSGSPGAGTSGGGSAGSSTGATCEAGSGLQGGGSDTCPNLAWRCVDESVGNPPVHLAGAECSAGHTGGCCSYSDKCLTNTDGSPNAQSAVEVAIGPCQAGCIANPSAQACVDCINSSLVNAGSHALSSGCGTCWTSLISCSFSNCLTPCLAGATDPGCRQCAFEHCVVGAGKFNECSGLVSNGGL
jgi:hypothetical protein